MGGGKSEESPSGMQDDGGVRGASGSTMPISGRTPSSSSTSRAVVASSTNFRNLDEDMFCPRVVQQQLPNSRNGMTNNLQEDDDNFFFSEGQHHMPDDDNADKPWMNPGVDKNTLFQKTENILMLEQEIQNTQDRIDGCKDDEEVKRREFQVHRQHWEV